NRLGMLLLKQPERALQLIHRRQGDAHQFDLRGEYDQGLDVGEIVRGEEACKRKVDEGTAERPVAHEIRETLVLESSPIGGQELIDSAHDYGHARNVAVADGLKVSQIPHVPANE